MMEPRDRRPTTTKEPFAHEVRARSAVAFHPTERRSDAALHLLFALDALEEGAEVSAAESVVPFALEKLDEERAGLRVLEQRRRFFHEDLQQVAAVGLAVDEN